MCLELKTFAAQIVQPSFSTLAPLVADRADCGGCRCSIGREPIHIDPYDEFFNRLGSPENGLKWQRVLPVGDHDFRVCWFWWVINERCPKKT